jgi:erythritol kinase
VTSVAIDAGTTAIKAVGYGDDGAELAVARRPANVARPRPGRAEQDMRQVWAATAEAVREVAAALPEPPSMLALTAQGDGCWLVDAGGEPTGPAVLWSDGRAAGIVDRWRDAGVLDAAFAANGSCTFPGLANAILAWFAEHDPDRLARSSAALTCGGWIFQRLTGVTAADESDASAPFLDLRTRAYSPELIALFGLEDQARLLPPVVGDAQRAAGLRSSAAADLGLPAGLPVVMAPYDVAATAIGAGAVATGAGCTILGTTLCTEVVRDAVDTTGEPAGLTVALDSASPDRPGRVLRVHPTLAGTEVVDWAAALLGLDSPRALSDLAGTAGPGDGPVFLPYLSPAGERAPFLDTNARGTFWGLSLEHGRERIAHAVFEGLSLTIKDCVAATGTAATELRLCGGGAASDVWCRMIADAVGVPAVRSADTEVGAKGALLSGLVATGAEPDLAHAAAAYVREGDRFTPDPDRAAHYERRFADFLDLRGIAGAGWRRQAAGRG